MLLPQEKALYIFALEDDDVVIHINSRFRFNLVVSSVAKGSDFRQTAAAMAEQKNHTELAIPRSISYHVLGNLDRVLIAASLQMLRSLSSSKENWSFSSAGDGSTCYSVSFYDIRARIMVRLELRNVNVVSFFEKHTTFDWLVLSSTPWSETGASAKFLFPSMARIQ